jgi:hypothetical protein
MKKQIIFICLIILVESEIFCQEYSKQKNHLNTFLVHSDFLTWLREFGLLSLTANYERLLKVNTGYVSFSIGGGPLLGIVDYYSIYPTGELELDALFGRNHHFLEIGSGLKMFFGNHVVPSLVKSRLGYRLMTGQRVVFRISYELLLVPVEMGFSIGLGYRFGGRLKAK